MIAENKFDAHLVFNPREHVYEGHVTHLLPNFDPLGIAVVKELVTGLVITLQLSSKRKHLNKDRASPPPSNV